jgi:hypothetical protein
MVYILQNGVGQGRSNHSRDYTDAQICDVYLTGHIWRDSRMERGISRHQFRYGSGKVLNESGEFFFGCFEFDLSYRVGG